MNTLTYVIFLILALCQIKGHRLGKIQPRLIGTPVVPTATDPRINVAFFTSEFPNSAICSGAVFHYKWIATAASCIRKYSLVDLRIKRGRPIDAAASGETHYSEGAFIDRIIIHPSYNDRTRTNDIALVKPLENMINDDVPMQPYRITKTNQNTENLVVLLRGYGPDNPDVDSPITSALYQARSVLVNVQECRKYDSTVQSTKLCTLRGRVCTGDQGGPLVSQASNELIGIISVSAQVEALCGLGLKPIETYTNLFLYRKWITDTIGSTDI